MSPGEGDLNYSSSWGGTHGGLPSKYIISAKPEKRNTVTKLMQQREIGIREEVKFGLSEYRHNKDGRRRLSPSTLKFW